jgi:hypothetical protein
MGNLDLGLETYGLDRLAESLMPLHVLEGLGRRKRSTLDIIWLLCGNGSRMTSGGCTHRLETETG